MNESLVQTIIASIIAPIIGAVLKHWAANKAEEVAEEKRRTEDKARYEGWVKILAREEGVKNDQIDRASEARQEWLNRNK
jgi:hypothetical protein